jgi:hypothetical protein
MASPSGDRNRARNIWIETVSRSVNTLAESLLLAGYERIAAGVTRTAAL